MSTLTKGNRVSCSIDNRTGTSLLLKNPKLSKLKDFIFVLPDLLDIIFLEQFFTDIQ